MLTELLLGIVLFQTPRANEAQGGSTVSCCGPWRHYTLLAARENGQEIQWQKVLKPLDLHRLYQDLKVASARKLPTRNGERFWDLQLVGDHQLGGAHHTPGPESASVRLLVEEKDGEFTLHPLAGVRLRTALAFTDNSDLEALVAASSWMCGSQLSGIRAIVSPTLARNDETDDITILFEAQRRRPWSRTDISPLARVIECTWRNGMLAKVKESRPSWIPTAEIHQFESNILDGYESLPIEQAEIYWPRYSRSTLMADLRHPAGPYWSIPIREMLAPDLQGATVQLDRLFDVGPTGPAYQARIVTSKGLEYSVTGMMRGIYPNTDFQDGFGALISLGNILVVPHESREAALWACLDMLRDAPLRTESAELVFSETADPRRLVISARLREQHPVLGSEISLEYQDGWLLSLERRF